MKTFSFIAGNKYDHSHGMSVGIDRDRLPPSMRVRLVLDDDGKAFPRLPRPDTRTVAPATGDSYVVFVESAKLRVKLGDTEGNLHVEAGTRFELTGKGRLGDVKVTGAATVTMRGALRVAEIGKPRAEFAIDKRPNDFHIFTIEVDPTGAQPGQGYPVDITQKDATGTVIGGITVIFKF